MPILSHFQNLLMMDFLNDKLVFARGYLEVAFSSAFTDKDPPVLDLMTSAKSYSSRGTHDTYSFLHLTIQEYLGAFWAAKNLSESEKLDFLEENLKNERFYMVLQFFAGITSLNIHNVHTIFDKNLCEPDELVHICHLLYESGTKSHSLCHYVANNCISKKEIHLVRETYDGEVLAYCYHRPRPRRYSKFDCLMISHFLAYSNCQWIRLTVNLDDVQLLHKVFNGLKSCCMTIQEVTIEADIYDLFFYKGTICLLDNIPQFGTVKLKLLLAFISFPHVAVEAEAENNLKNLLTNSRVIKSIYMETFGGYKFGNFNNVLFEGIACNGALVTSLKLQTLAVNADTDFEALISLLIKWNSNLKLTTLSIYPCIATYCREENRCNQCCTLLSTFLSKNASLRQIDISLPFNVNQLMRCMSIIQSGLDQNLTLERLSINKEFMFKRNEHTSKLELIQGHELHASQSSQATIENTQDDENFPITSQGMHVPPILPQLGGIQAQCGMSSNSPCVDDRNLYQDSPAKRVKVESCTPSSSFNYYQSTFPHPHVHPASQNVLPAISPHPSQTFMMPPRLPPTDGHTMQQFSEPERHHPATIPSNAVQTIYNPNTHTLNY